MIQLTIALFNSSSPRSFLEGVTFKYLDVEDEGGGHEILDIHTRVKISSPRT